MRAMANLSVKGTRYHKAAELLQEGSLSSGLAIRLEHEPDNPHDKNAVAVRVERTGAMLGHISRELAAKYVALLNSGKVIEAEITNIVKDGAYTNIDVRVVYEQSDAQFVEKHSSRLQQSASALPTKPGIYPIRHIGSGRQYISSSNRYRRRYRSWSSRSYAPSQYSRLVSLFGGAVGDVKQAFLALDDDALDALLEDYSALHGDQAGKYARKTFPSWKSGATKLSGQTMERLVELVPPYLSSEQRFSLLRQVLQKNKPPKPYKSIRINVKEPVGGCAELDSALASMQHHDVLAHVPEKVMQAASWLYDDDITAARAMLAEAERKENAIILASATREIALLKRTIQSGQVKSASFSVQMPAGNLSVVAYEPSKCFVATVCFGADSNEVLVLRAWRDNSLIHNKNGRELVIWYYNNGETLSRIIGCSPAIKGFVRFCLKLLVYWLDTVINPKQGLNHE